MDRHTEESCLNIETALRKSPISASERARERGGNRRQRAGAGNGRDRDRIQRGADEKCQERGGEHGRDQDDWYEAERQNRERSSE
jgi:hypothetical protein